VQVKAAHVGLSSIGYARQGLSSIGYARQGRPIEQ